MNSIKIYRSGVFFVEIKPASNSMQQKKIMGDNEVKIEFDSSYIVQFRIGDTATIFGETYKLNTIPSIAKISGKLYKYSMTMQAEYYDLGKVQCMFYDADNNLKEGDFSLMGDAKQFVALLQKNINRVLTGFTFGEVPATPYKNITFSNDSCLSALAKVVDAFETEYFIEGKKIGILKQKNQKTDIYQHGKGNGLYEINRNNIEQSQVITRVYPFGSEKNIPSDYKNYSKRLRLAERDPKLISRLTCTEIGIKQKGYSKYVFNWDQPESAEVETVSIKYRKSGSTVAFTEIVGSKVAPIEIGIVAGVYEFCFQSNAFAGSSWINKSTPVIPISTPFLLPIFQGNSLPYIESNVARYGVIEKSVIFEDIYPSRTGRVSSIDAGDPFSFIDVDLDFDVNAYLLPGLSAKVTFNTGQLAGYSFDISSFSNSIKKFRIVKNKNEIQFDVPSTLFRPAIGDNYILTDIRMPIQYIEAAEQRLHAKAVEYLESYSIPNYVYTIVFDPVYLKNKKQIPAIGDVVWIKDDDLELNKPIRIIATTRDIVDEWSVSVEMADILSNGTIKQLTDSISSMGNNVNSVSADIKNSNILQNNKSVGDFRIEQGTIEAKDLKQKPPTGTFKTIFIDEATGLFYKG